MSKSELKRLAVLTPITIAMQFFDAEIAGFMGWRGRFGASPARLQG